MLRVWAMIALAGCSFEPGGYRVLDASAPDDDGRTDGPATDAFEPDAAPPPIAFVQGTVFTNAGSNSVVAAPFLADQMAGNLNVVVISWSDQSDMVSAVADTKGNTYFSATALLQSEGYSMRIYYASNIKAGPNLVSIALSGNVPSPKVRMFEYAGIALTLPVDKSAAGSGSSTTASAGPINTTAPRALLFAANTVGTVSGAGPDFMERQVDDGDLVEDRIVDVAGAYTATATLTNTGGWIMQLVAFKGL